MMGRSAVLVAMAGIWAACTGGAAPERAVGGLLLEPPADADGLQLSLHAPPGLDAASRRCHLAIMPGGDGIDLEAIEHRLSDGTAQVRLSHTDLDVDAAWQNAGLALCEDLDAHAGPVAYASDEAAGGVSLPTGVALHFAPLEVVLLEARFDASAGAAGDEARINLWFAQSPPTTRTEVALGGDVSSGQ